MKLCKDCKWIAVESDDMDYEYAKCNAPQNLSYDLVSGAHLRRYSHCSNQREDGRLNTYIYRSCGKNGRWWRAA